jgi:hypothetical protein
MRIEQCQWTTAQGWAATSVGHVEPGKETLALVFGSKAALGDQALIDDVRRRYPGARMLGCSTAGEICGDRVTDDSLVVTAVQLDHTSFRGACTRLISGDGFDSGKRLAAQLSGDGLAHVFVLSEGHRINGTALVAGLADGLPAGVTVTGGLAGDGERFGETTVLWDEPMADGIAAVGFYGDRLQVGCGSLGGWDPFGPERLITRSAGNVLYELDGQSALGLYKRYLGDQALGLPAAALLFPLSLRDREGAASVVRTILSIDEATQSMTFAGDMPQGSYARLMRANFDRLIDGAVGAARTSRESLASSTPDLGILISCVGRKMVLRQRVEEEVEGVRDVLGPQATLTGFYSYGEISPFTPAVRCELHNQTMTVTTLTER